MGASAVSFARPGVKSGAFCVVLEKGDPEGTADEAPQTDSREDTASAGAGPAVVVAGAGVGGHFFFIPCG